MERKNDEHKVVVPPKMQKNKETKKKANYWYG